MDAPEPTSPALPAVRPVLAARLDPFAGATTPTEPSQQAAGRAVAAKKKTNKLAIFSDEGEQAQSVLCSKDASPHWDSIGSLQGRKKENTVEARAWAGETLKTAKTNTGVPKMMVFKVSQTLIPKVPPNTCSRPQD